MRIFLSVVLFALFTWDSSVLSTDLLNNLEPVTVEIINDLKQIGMIDGSGVIFLVAWSPNGNRLATIRDKDTTRVVEVWDFSDGQIPGTLTVTFTPVIVDKLEWSPDGKTIVTYGQYSINASVEFNVLRWNAETGELIDSLLEARVNKPSFDPPAPPILGWTKDYSAFVLSESSNSILLPNNITFTDEGAFGVIHSVKWSPDNKYLAVLRSTSDTYRIHILDAQTSKSIIFFEGPDYYVRDMVWNTDSSFLAVASVSNGINRPQLNIRFYAVDEIVQQGDEFVLSQEVDERLGAVLSKAGLISPPPGIAWSPNNDLVAVSFPSSIEFYEVGSFNRMISIPQNDTVSIDWNSDNSVIVSGGADGVIRLWGIVS